MTTRLGSAADPRRNAFFWTVRGRAVFVLALGFLATAAACGGGTKQQKCGAEGQCLPGFVCQEGLCISQEMVTTDGGPATLPDAGHLTPGPTGGRFCGLDGVCITIPAGALTETVDIQIKRASAGIVVDNVIMLSRAYSIEPTSTHFAIKATVSIPVDPALHLPADQLGIWRSSAVTGPWSRLDGTSSSTAAAGATDQLGLFAAARPVPVVDAGVPLDTGIIPDAGFVDGGLPDARPIIDTGIQPPDSGLDAGIIPPTDSGRMEPPDTGPEDTGMVGAEDPGYLDARPPYDSGRTWDSGINFNPDAGFVELPDVVVISRDPPDTSPIGGGMMDTGAVGMAMMDTGVMSSTNMDTGATGTTQGTDTGAMMTSTGDTGAVGPMMDTGSTTAPMDTGAMMSGTGDTGAMSGMMADTSPIGVGMDTGPTTGLPDAGLPSLDTGTNPDASDGGRD